MKSHADRLREKVGARNVRELVARVLDGEQRAAAATAERNGRGERDVP